MITNEQVAERVRQGLRGDVPVKYVGSGPPEFSFGDWNIGFSPNAQVVKYVVTPTGRIDFPFAGNPLSILRMAELMSLHDMVVYAYITRP